MILFLTGNLLAQPAVEWDKLQTLSPGFGPYPTVACQTTDGGVMIGFAAVSNVGSKYFILKLDRKGIKEWEKTYGGNKDDELKSVIQTSDGGYLIGGQSDSDASGDKSDSAYSISTDYWIIKITADGTKQWDKTYGGTGTDNLATTIQTSDGGYLVGGLSSSPANGIKSENPYGEFDYWVIKLDANGNKQWDKTLGGSLRDGVSSLIQAPDGGFIVSGDSDSEINGNKTAGSKGSYDYWIVKLSASGTKLWDKTYGGNGFDRDPIIVRTEDNGYLLAGNSWSDAGEDRTAPNIGYYDLWIVKINSEGEKQWDKSYGGNEYDMIQSIQPTPDGGYLIGMVFYSDLGDTKTDPTRDFDDSWIIKIDASGTKLWDKNLGGSPRSISTLAGAFATSDGGYLTTGYSYSYTAGGDKTEAGPGVWTVKLLAESNNKKLAFSADSLDFVLSSIPTDSTRNASLSANYGSPEITLRKSAADWLDLPSPALDTLPFTVTTAGIASGQYSSVVAATAPGYARALLKVNLTVNEVTNSPVLSPIGDKVLQPGEILKFTADATAGFGQTKIFSLVNAPAGASIDASTGAFSWNTPWESGTYPFNVRVSIAGHPDLYDEETITVILKLTDPADVPAIRINAGGKEFTTADGRVFQADAFFDGRRTSFVGQVDILNTPDDDLYRNTRSEDFFNYDIPVQTGVYKVTLHFAEIYWGVSPNRPAIDIRRKFNVEAEGQLKLENYSILRKAGAPLTAVTETFETDVKDGFLSLQFVKIADRASVAAIEVEFIKPLVELSTGPVADAYIRYGSSSQTNFGLEQTIDLKSNTNSDYDRAAYMKFSLAGLSSINNARIRIYGRNYEGSKTVQVGLTGIDNDNWTETGITASNAPSGNSVFLGKFNSMRKARFYEIDITEFAKSQLAQDKTLTLILADLFATNNRVIFNSRENAVNPPELIVTTTEPVISSARMAESEIAKEAGEETESSIIYPNPVKDRFTIRVGSRHQHAIGLSLFSETGNLIPISTPEGLQAGAVSDIDISRFRLPAGIYLLNIQSASTSETLKVLLAN
ncbi:CBM96 family carbohydrate-binding protein [Dyadobacter sediminis]|uniref:CBM96 family carbohydrate-binding protein n=1 Tax=Dyadobacter sediminis TaxID=1493691 RepID=UPI001486D6C0|nr:DNRLRE domain-containing protein [Dyadobacter sediminis]